MKISDLRMGGRPLLLAWGIAAAMAAGCGFGSTPPRQESVSALSGAPSVPSAAARERDEILILLAYSSVLKDWQSGDDGSPRGHNIGAVLVDPEGRLVGWARNCNRITGNSTQHAEVRLMMQYLSRTRRGDLKGFTIYTTLEPCAMCAGMMTLTRVSRTVYGQTDPDFGKAIERLTLDSRALPGWKGYGPYPRPVRSEPVSLAIRDRLDEAYRTYVLAADNNITGWLRSLEAKRIYEEAYRLFRDYKVVHPSNAAVLDSARTLYETISEDP